MLDEFYLITVFGADALTWRKQCIRSFADCCALAKNVLLDLCDLSLDKKLSQEVSSIEQLLCIVKVHLFEIFTNDWVIVIK